MFGMDGTLTRHEASVLPDAVFGAEPSPALVAFLSVVDPNELSGHDQVKVLRAHQRLISHFQAKFYEDLAALADVMFEFDDDWELATEATAMELRAALRLTRRMADIELDLAEALVHRLPRVGRALQTGQIDLRRARVLVAGTEHLDQTQAREVVDQMIDRAGELTTGELRARVRRACIATDPEEAVPDRTRRSQVCRRAHPGRDGRHPFHRGGPRQGSSSIRPDRPDCQEPPLPR
jgi:hypothetical protein